MRVFVTGATGLIGRRVVTALVDRGDAVVALSRSRESARQRLPGAVEVEQGDPAERGNWMQALADCDAVIHLAGEPLMARRWSRAQKERIAASRVVGTHNVVDALRQAGRGATLVSSSAVGFYGPHGDEELTESSPPGTDFLAAEVCVGWEREAQSLEPAGRVVRVRTGVVLAPKGGALAELRKPFRLFAGGRLGSGRQWVSWIHVDDLVGIMLLALDSPRASGPVNGTAPNPVTMAHLAKALGQVMGRPAWLPVPALAMRVALGEAAQTVLTGQRVLPRRALDLGYRFRFTTIESALEDLLGGGRAAVTSSE